MLYYSRDKRDRETEREGEREREYIKIVYRVYDMHDDDLFWLCVQAESMENVGQLSWFWFLLVFIESENVGTYT